MYDNPTSFVTDLAGGDPDLQMAEIITEPRR